jgi:flagellar protein FlaG
MITSVHNKADLLITPRKGGEPDKAAATRLPAARTQPDSSRDATQSTDRAVLDRAVAAVGEALKSSGTHVKLQLDQDSDQVVVKVLKESGEVIRQFPPKEVLELAKYLSEEGMLPPDKGVLFEGRV